MANVVKMNYINLVGIERLLISKPTGTKIYILKNGFKFKLFPEDQQKIDCPEMEYFYNLLLAQTELRFETISTPTQIVTENDMLYGYIAPFSKGTILRDIDPLLLIETLLSLLKKFEREVQELSEAGWIMGDFHDGNLLIDGQLSTITAIDTDCYEKVKTNPYKQNLKAIFSTIIYVILPKIQLSKAYKNKLIKRYFIMAQEGLIRTSEFLEILLTELKQYIIKDLTLEGLRNKI